MQQTCQQCESISKCQKDAKVITRTDSEKLFSTASLVFDVKRKGGGCWLLYDDRNREMASND